MNLLLLFHMMGLFDDKDDKKDKINLGTKNDPGFLFVVECTVFWVLLIVACFIISS